MAKCNCDTKSAKAGARVLVKKKGTEGIVRFLTKNNGILYENDLLHIRVKSKYKKNLGSSKGLTSRAMIASSTRREGWFKKNPDLVLAPQPSPTVARVRMESSALKRRSGAADKIQKSLATLDEVVSTSHLQATPTPARAFHPGSLLKESVLHPSHAAEATPTDYTPVVTPASSMESPKGYLSIMDETGLTRKLQMVPTPVHDATYMDSPRDMTRPGLMTFLEETTMGQANTTTLEDPTEKTGRELLSSFHKLLSSHPNPADVLELAYALEECCQNQLDVLKETEKQRKFSPSPRMLTELNLERSTWQLLHALYSDRVTEGQEEEMVTELLPAGQSDKEIAEELFIKDSNVRQAQIVVDWLEKNALSNLESFPTKVNYFTDSVTWENTLHDIRNGINREHLVTEVDPDAPTRQNRHLSELDAKDEHSLMKHLFACIRAGQLSKAQELCLQCGQPWRAAALEGWKLHHDPNVDKSMADNLDIVEGNLSRDLWKSSCWEMAKDPGYSVYEKAIYAAHSGNIGHLLPACQSWFDYVWAYFKVMVDVLTEQKLRACPRNTDHELEDLPTEYWNAVIIPEEIFQEIESSPSQVIKKQCQDHFHLVQKYVILDDLEGLVSLVHKWLKNNPSVHQLRFMAHLVLFIRGLGVVVEEAQCTEVLEAYVKGLIRNQYVTLVALYAVRLPSPLQVTCYAELLEGVQDPEDQRTCLELGKDAGLDVAIITKEVVENIRNTDLELSLDTTGLQLGREVEITKLDYNKINVINWLVFEDSQRAEAIRQGNALIRQFLAMRKHSAAREVFKKIPSNSVEVVTRAWQMKAGDSPLPVDLDNDLREYHSIKAYLDANDTFNAWFQHFHHRRPVPPSEPTQGVFKDQMAYEHKMKQYQMEDEQWTTLLMQLTEDATDRLYNVLLFAGGWMVDGPLTGPVSESRSAQLSLLRQLCLPQMCFLLHTVLHSTKQYSKRFSGCLSEIHSKICRMHTDERVQCLELADVIASENHKLHEVFRKDELQKFLSLLEKSASAMLDERQLELGYPL